jgi:signal transduction histidine kinase
LTMRRLLTTHRLGVLNLRGIGGQIAVLVVASIVALHLIMTASFLINRPDRHDGGGPHQFETAVRIIGSAPADERPRLLSDLARAIPQLDLRPLALEQPAAAEPGLQHLARHLGEGYSLVALAPESGEHRIGIVLPDGAMISAKMPAGREPPFWGGPWMMTALFAVISVTLLGLWAARALTAPLSAFARAAESFSLNGDAAPLPERGPEEVRAVARALNRMRSRITALIDDRTRMLAAISHDLRTPITRLRLRCEFIEDEAHRTRMLADLDQMRAMLEAVLSFLRNGHNAERMTLTDIASSLLLVADQFADMGHNVGYVGPDHYTATVRPGDLHRCITNLVENAVRFGSEITLRLTPSAEGAIIEIEDDGPGICEERKEIMLRPFERGDVARNMDEAAGFGLGLSIANAIVLAHGGALSLHDRMPQGLRVRILLPADAASRRAAA